MFKIGIFASMNKITVKTLRYYDKEGLLKPAKVDDWTGYRFYSADQMIPLRNIISLKKAGFSIDEIKTITNKVQTSGDLIVHLQNKRKEVSDKLATETERIKHINRYINDLEREDKMPDYNVITKELPTVIAACMKTKVVDYDEFFKVVPPMGDIMQKQGGKCLVPEYCFTLFLDGEYKDKDISVEVCEAVVEAKKDSDGVVYKEVTGGLAACVLHKGPYSTIGAAYTVLTKWIEDNGYEAVDVPRESYIDGIWNKDSDKDWLTEVQIPIKK